MEVHYGSRRLKKTLGSERLVVRYYGELAHNLLNRLTELKAARSLLDIPETPPPARHKLKGKLAGCWGIWLSPNWRLIVRPYGSFDVNDLSTIGAVVIESIEDYH